MTPKNPQLLVQAAPFLQQGVTTPQVMRDILWALVPVMLASLWYFGMSAVLVLLASSLGAIITEWVFNPSDLPAARGKSGQPALRRMSYLQRGASLRDGSALLTGVLLGLILPPAIPLWMAFLGGMVAVGLGKLVWGGLGNNLFNPALVGRAFLQASFPTAITTWTLPNQGFLSLQSSTLAAPLMQGSVDAATAATPLGLMKFQQQMTPYHELVLGNTAGSLGETSGLAILLGGVYLCLRRSIDWRIPTGIVLSAGVFATCLFIVDGSRFPDPVFVVFSGSLLFGAVFMATDPVTSPLTSKGTWWFAIGIGTLIVLIRVFGGLPEGVMYAILLMNAATPLISRCTQPRVFGHH